MRINHNIAALNTYRQLSANTASTSKSLEKLSSGLRINRAGDDAAGLAISEKMRGQIRGLDQATRNANDGISLIQTAEGALNETHSILQRMRELAVQSSNDTNTVSDRIEMQKEIDQLKTEITRISTDTEFNTKKLLDGSMAYGSKMSSGANITGASVTAGSAVSAGVYNVSVEYTAASPVSSIKQSGTYTGDTDIKATYDGTDWISDTDGTTVITFSDAGNGLTIENAQKGDKISVTAAVAPEVTIDGDGVSVSANPEPTVEAGTYTLTYDGSDWKLGEDIIDLADYGLEANSPSDGNSVEVTISAGKDASSIVTPRKAIPEKANVSVTDANGNAINESNFNFTYKAGLADSGVGSPYTDSFTVTDNSMIFHIGANSAQNTSLAIGKMDAESLGVDALDLTSQIAADEAITTIDAAISEVSSQRAALGGMQNRLEHTINNLGTTSENLSASESRIRDVDMAQEMMEFTKNNILSQASQAMLAQANMQPQSVLQLLQ